ncbi:MAG: hypothetical protein QOJ21_2939 [Solirubrobacteraceae bacterium]|jgi:nucleotide-binding universal stress UspA family protein|nr:hypothetical protein [Solirubrobacteraceae bacterium]
MFKTIVVGVDGRQGGRDALHLARAFARIGDGRIVAVRVFPYAVPLRGAPPVPDIVLQEQTEAELDRELAAQGVTAQAYVIGDASPAQGLHRVAEHEQADLIVVGSTHHGAVGRAFAGDDAVATIHGSPCPVAVAPRAAAAADGAAFGRIGVGYDSRPESRQALALAAQLAKDAGARLALLSVVETPLTFRTHELADTDWLAHERNEAAAQIHEALEQTDVEASGDVIVGLAAEALTDLSHRVDLLVVGSRAWGPVRRLFLGSTAADVLRGSGCPVVVLPRSAAPGQPGEQDSTGAAAASRSHA